jgi:hypothetical protein
MTRRNKCRGTLIHWRHYRTLDQETEEDMVVLCADCATHDYGLTIDPHTEAITAWDTNRYPWHPDAEPDDVHWRPNADWPPSFNELEHVRRGAIA